MLMAIVVVLFLEIENLVGLCPQNLTLLFMTQLEEKNFPTFEKI
jgi:hypothetical protein